LQTKAPPSVNSIKAYSSIRDTLACRAFLGRFIYWLWRTTSADRIPHPTLSIHCNIIGATNNTPVATVKSGYKSSTEKDMRNTLGFNAMLESVPDDNSLGSMDRGC
jgi:hypothetical protein